MSDFVKSLDIRGTNHVIQDSNACPKLTVSQRGLLLSYGTYQGNPVDSGTIFVNETGKLEEFTYNTDYVFDAVYSDVKTGYDSVPRIAYGNGIFVDQRGYRSEDGLTWTPPTTAPVVVTSFYNVAFGNGTFVLTDIGSLEPWYSTDGSNWYVASNFPWGGGLDATDYPVVFCGDRFIVFNGESSAQSTDGISWTSAVVPEQLDTSTPICYGGGRIVAFAKDNQTDSYISTDKGATWTRHTSVLSHTATSMVYATGKFIVMDNYAGNIWSSTDGITWSKVREGSAVLLNGYTSLVSDGVNFVMASASPSSSSSGHFDAYTTDGETWEDAGNLTIGRYGVGAIGNGRIVVPVYSTNYRTTFNVVKVTPPNTYVLTQLSYSKAETDTLLSSKQDSLSAGTGITIASDTISANQMTGADGTNAGTTGIVPAPSETDNTKYLRGDGTWSTPTDTTYTAGNGISISSGVISVSDPTLTNKATASNSLSIAGYALTGNASLGVNVGYSSSANSQSVSMGYAAHVYGAYSVGIGCGVISHGVANIALGNGCRNDEQKTFKVSLWDHGAGNAPSTDVATNCYTLLKANGSIPKDRFGDLQLADLTTAGTGIQISNPELNVSLNGDVTIANGIIYGTGRYQWAYLNPSPLTASDVCEITCKIHTPTTLDTNIYPIFTFGTKYCIYIDENLKFSQLANNVRDTGTTTAQPDTDYLIKLTSDGNGNYAVYVNGNQEITTTTSIISTDQFNIGIYNNGQTYFHGDGGYIDLKETYMTKNGNEIWRGYTTSVISSSGGGVTSVNGQTGAVTLTASDLGALQNSSSSTNGLGILASQYSSGDGSTAIGVGSLTSSLMSTAIGYNAWVGNSRAHGTAIGALSNAGGGVANTVIGSSTISNSQGCVGLGASCSIPANNNGTLWVALTPTGFPSSSNTYSYKLLESTGLIPAARLGAVPSTAGSSYYKITTDGQGGVTPSWSSSVLENLSTNSAAIVIGQTPTYFTTATSCVSIGEQAESNNGAVTVGPFSWSDQYGTTVGVGSSAQGEGAVAIGNTTVASGASSIAIGNGATAQVDDTIMIGHGTNSTAGTMAVGLGTGLAPVTYTLLDANGNIPAARLGSLPTANGNYTLRLTITNGVPTLSWVAV